MAINDNDLLNFCFINLPATEGFAFILGYEQISANQVGGARLDVLRQARPKQFTERLLAPNTHVVCYHSEANVPWKIYLPTPLLEPTVQL